MTSTLEQLRAVILDESLPLATRQTAADLFVVMRRDAVPEEQRRALVNAVLDDRRQPRLVRLAAAKLYLSEFAANNLYDPKGRTPEERLIENRDRIN